MKDIKSYIGQDTQFIMTYDFLLWYFGASRLTSAILLADIFNVHSMRAEADKEYFSGQIMLTTPYIQQRIPISAKAVTSIMKNLEEEDIIAVRILYQHRFLMVNIAKILAIKTAYEQYIKKVKENLREYGECQDLLKPKVIQIYRARVDAIYEKYITEYEAEYQEFLDYKKLPRVETYESCLDEWTKCPMGHT